MLTLHSRVLLFAAALLSPVSAAHGASDPDSRIPSWRQSHFESGNPAVISLYTAAHCARLRDMNTVNLLLGSAVGSTEERAAFARLLPPEELETCLSRIRYDWRNRSMLRGPARLRGALAELDYAGARLRPAPGGQPRDLSAQQPLSAAPRAVASCAVARSPLLAHEVLRYPYGRPGEQRALQALDATFLACLPEGSRLIVTRLTMRALIAQALYEAARSQSGSFVHA